MNSPHLQKALIPLTLLLTLSLISCGGPMIAGVSPSGTFGGNAFGGNAFGGSGFGAFGSNGLGNDSGSSGSMSYGGLGSNVNTYTVIPQNFSGKAYQHNGRYYSGGQLQKGNYKHLGRSYDSRYYHNGHYYYGGDHRSYSTSAAQQKKNPRS